MQGRRKDGQERDETRTLAELNWASVGEAEALGGALAPGTEVGRYVVLRELGMGGMGLVVAAYDPELDRKVALKLLHSEAGAQERLVREARALAKLSHPNVVTVFDVGTHDGRVWLSMEYVEGETLACWLRAEARSWREVVAVFLEAGRGLAAAHRAGLVHGDFKPSNVIVARDGPVRVLDFGLARGLASNAEEAPAPGGTGETVLYGTPSYMAPERLRGEPGDARSDQYSFCVAHLEALNGALPETDPGSGERVWEAALESTRNGRVPRWVRDVLARGVRHAPTERWESLDPLLAALSPERRRRWQGLAASLLIGVAAIGLYLSTAGRRGLCTGAETRLAEIWDAGAKVAIRRAFLTSGFPFAQEAYERVQAGLDRYTSRWVAEHTAACRATHVLGEQSQQLLDLRMICLDERLSRLAATSRLLVAPSPQLVGRAPGLVAELPSLAPCADRRSLAELAPLPEDPEVRRRIDASRERFAELSARRNRGDTPARAEVEAAAREAVEIGYRPWEAAALISLGEFQGEVFGRWEEAIATFQDAAAAAIAGSDGYQLTIAYARLVHFTGQLRQRPEEGERWARLGEAALEALREGSPSYEAALPGLALTRGNLANAQGRLREAARHYRRALEATERVSDPSPWLRAQALSNLAMIEGLTDGEDPRPLFTRAIEIMEGAFGPWSPGLATLLVNYGSYLGESGDYASALVQARRAHDVFASADDPDTFMASVLEGQILLRLDRPGEAEEPLRRAIEEGEAAFGEEYYLVGHASCALGSALLLQGRLADAAAPIERAAAILEDRRLPSSVNALLASARRAQLLGRHAEAVALGERAEELIAELGLPTGDRTRAEVLTVLGVSHVGAGSPERAMEPLRRVVSLELPPSEDLVAGEAELALAEALGPADQERAHELLRSAAAKLGGAKSWYTRRLFERAQRALAEEAQQ